VFFLVQQTIFGNTDAENRVAEKLSSPNETISSNTRLLRMPRAIHKVIHRICGYRYARKTLEQSDRRR
jgi:hypothetical protein